MRNFFQYISGISYEGAPLVEFIDNNNKPLIIAPITEVSRLKLGYKVVWVCLVDYKHRVYLQRRASHLTTYPNFWDFSVSGYVLAGESREDTALRELNTCFGMHNILLSTPTSYVFSLEEVPILATLFTFCLMSSVPKPNSEYIQEGMFLDEDELFGFASVFPECLTPWLSWAIHNKVLFKTHKGNKVNIKNY